MQPARQMIAQRRFPRAPVLDWSSFRRSAAPPTPAITETGPLDALFRSLPGWVGLVEFLCNDEAYGGLGADCNPRCAGSDHALTMSVELEGTFEPYLNGRSKNLQSNMCRYQNRLTADRIRYATTDITEPFEMAEVVVHYAELEGRRWKNSSQG